MPRVQPFHPTLPPKAVIAHRGASAYAAENTLTAFRAAAEMGAHAMELDVKRSADGQVVVMHDATLARTAHGHPGVVRELPYAILRTVNVGPRGRPEGVPTLQQVLDAVGQRLVINIELTNYDALCDDLPQRVAAILAAWNQPQRVWVSSFNPVALFRCARWCPQVSLGFLTQPGARGAALYRVLAPWLPHAALHPHRAQWRAAWVRRAHAAGLKVFPYTINAYPALRAALAAPWIDGVFTDRPDVALHARATVLSPVALGSLSAT